MATMGEHSAGRAMTIKIERPSFQDKILAYFGKKRAVFIPDDRKGGYFVAPRECFFSALFRPKCKVLPQGWVYCDDNETK